MSSRTKSRRGSPTSSDLFCRTLGRLRLALPTVDSQIDIGTEEFSPLHSSSLSACSQIALNSMPTSSHLIPRCSDHPPSDMFSIDRECVPRKIPLRRKVRGRAHLTSFDLFSLTWWVIFGGIYFYLHNQATGAAVTAHFNINSKSTNTETRSSMEEGNYNTRPIPS